ncbi:MAG: hypothetical protein ACJ75B_13465 [Flavisolibacter sp.]
MKKIILSLFGITALIVGADAQCNQTVQISSIRSYFLNATDEVKGSKDENVVVTITKTTITIMFDGKAENGGMSGNIKEMSCAWTEAFKEGKTVVRTDLVDQSGDVKDATITLEGKQGKLTLLFEAKERPDQKIKLEVAHFEQKEN